MNAFLAHLSLWERSCAKTRLTRIYGLFDKRRVAENTQSLGKVPEGKRDCSTHV